MSNNKQTALDWYMEAMNQYFDEVGIHCGLYKDNKIYEQAKAMHRQEIIDAVDGFPIHTRHMDGEEYYNETFGGNNEQQ